MTQADNRLSYGFILSYALPAFSLQAIMFSVAIFLPNYYTDQLGVSAGMLSWVFLVARIWDAVTDPTMGHISDRTRTRWGRRRPYFLFSALPIWLVYYLIWAPGRSLSSTGLFWHLMIFYLLLYTFWTMFYIPYYSLGMEITSEYHERSRLFGGAQAFGIIGVIAGTVAPAFFAKTAGSKIAGYPWMGVVIGGLSAAFILITFFRIKERPDAATLETYPFLKSIAVTFRNRSFVILILTYMLTMTGQSFISPLCLYMAKYVVKTEWIVQPLILAYMGIAFLTIPLWLFIAKRIGKKKTWIIALLFSTTGYAATFLANEGQWIIWMLCTIPTGAASGCTLILMPSIQADVIDQDELETGTRREGAFVGVRSFVDKAAVGIAIFIGLQGLHFIGFEPNVEQTKIVKIGIKTLISFLPAGLIILAALIFQMFPITKEVYAEIRTKLDARKNDQGVVVSDDD